MRVSVCVYASQGTGSTVSPSLALEISSPFSSPFVTIKLIGTFLHFTPSWDPGKFHENHFIIPM